MREAREVIARAACARLLMDWDRLPRAARFMLLDNADAILAALAAAGLAVVPLCACPQRAEVAAAARTHGPNSAERWRLCGHARCPAVEGGDA